VAGADQHQCEGRDIGIGDDATQVLLDGKIGRDHRGGLAQ
jgi:hypothetical protein